MRVLLVATLLVGACAHVPPADPDAAPAPWPAPSPSLVKKGEPAGVEPPAAKKPPVPPLKNDVIPPTPPQSR